MNTHQQISKQELLRVLEEMEGELTEPDKTPTYPKYDERTIREIKSRLGLEKGDK